MALKFMEDAEPNPPHNEWRFRVPRTQPRSKASEVFDVPLSYELVKSTQQTGLIELRIAGSKGGVAAPASATMKSKRVEAEILNLLASFRVTRSRPRRRGFFGHADTSREQHFPVAFAPEFAT